MLSPDSLPVNMGRVQVRALLAQPVGSRFADQSKPLSP